MSTKYIAVEKCCILNGARYFEPKFSQQDFKMGVIYFCQKSHINTAIACLFVVRGTFICHLTECHLSRSMRKTVHVRAWLIQEDPTHGCLTKRFSR